VIKDQLLNGQLQLSFLVDDNIVKKHRAYMIKVIIISLVLLIACLHIISVYYMNKNIISPLKMIENSVEHLAYGTKTYHYTKLKIKVFELKKLLNQFYVMDKLVRKRENDLVWNQNKLIETVKKLQSAQAQLIISEKLAGIGQLAAGVAHEINNPLGFVSGNNEIVIKYIKAMKDIIIAYSTETDKDKIKEKKEILDIDYIMEDIDDLLNDNIDGLCRVKEIVSNLKNFSRIDQRDNFYEVDIEKHIKDTLNIAKNELKYHVNIETKFGKNKNIICNGGQINQVLLNIIINATQAIKEQKRDDYGLIKIQTKSDESNMIITISDDGPGIPESIKGKIFDPFFTTKKVGTGTGLGLNISYDIVTNKHKGKIL